MGWLSPCRRTPASPASLPPSPLPQVPLDERIIFSGNLFQYQEDNKKWRNRFSLVPHNYGLILYENKVAYERQVPPRAIINSAGYKILTSMDQYLELVGNSLPGKRAPIPGQNALHRLGIWLGERAALIPELQAPCLQKDWLGLELQAGAQHEGGLRPEPVWAPSESPASGSL